MQSKRDSNWTLAASERSLGSPGGAPRPAARLLRLLPLLATALLAACSKSGRPRIGSDATPMSYLHTYGPAGDGVTRLGYVLGGVSLAVIVIIAVLLLAALLRHRAPLSSPDSLAVNKDAGGMEWIYIGVGISTVGLLLCLAWTLHTIGRMGPPPASEPLTIEITAHQWWWEARYDNPQASRIFTTANEIHIPVGRPVRLQLKSADVIHSFWIPQLGGKTDVIPGQTNTSWLQADSAGIYTGHCAEYCGLSHARMAMHVVAEPPQTFEKWWTQQLGDAGTPGEPSPRQQAFVAHCGACHAVRGTEAAGHIGPDLTHLMSRQHIAGGVLDNSPDVLAAWINDPNSFKPGTLMPKVPLTGQQLVDIVWYLQTLK